MRTLIPTARYCLYQTAHAVLFSWLNEAGEDEERLHLLEEKVAGLKYRSREEAEFVAHRFNDWIGFRVANRVDISTSVVNRFIASANRDRIGWRWTQPQA